MGKESTCNVGDTGRHGLNPQVGKIPWRRAWQTIPVFLPGKLHGQRNLVGYSPWGHKELDTTEVTEHTKTGNTYDLPGGPVVKNLSANAD